MNGGYENELQWESRSRGRKGEDQVRDKDPGKKCERKGAPTTPPSAVEGERNEILVLRLGYESSAGDKAPG